MPYKDRQKQRDYQRKWYAARREKYLDGKTCEWCGSDEYLEIHHLNPEEKDSHRIFSWSDERIRKELAKCIILCRTCHFHAHGKMERTEEEVQQVERALRNLDIMFG